IVRLLLEDSRTVHDRSDQHGMTPLMHASCKGYLEILRLINLHKSNPNLEERFGYTALHIAVSERVAGTVGLLLIRDDVDPNSQDKKGNTPLNQAIESGEKRVIGLLLDPGDVDPNRYNRHEVC
ncbi:ankyrin repeat-containing domain protein, partial [Lipomyces orientalis]